MDLCSISQSEDEQSQTVCRGHERNSFMFIATRNTSKKSRVFSRLTLTLAVLYPDHPRYSRGPVPSPRDPRHIPSSLPVTSFPYILHFTISCYLATLIVTIIRTLIQQTAAVQRSNGNILHGLAPNLSLLDPCNSCSLFSSDRNLLLLHNNCFMHHKNGGRSK